MMIFSSSYGADDDRDDLVIMLTKDNAYDEDKPLLSNYLPTKSKTKVENKHR